MKDEVYEYLKKYGFNKDNLNKIEQENEDIYFIYLNKVRENINFFEGTTLCNECFDPYIPDIKTMLSRIPKDMLQDIDFVAKESGRTRNEIITMFLDFALKNTEIIEKQ